MCALMIYQIAFPSQASTTYLWMLSHAIVKQFYLSFDASAHEFEAK